MIKYSSCCSAPLIILRSVNLKICSDCNKKYDFYLKEGQKPLFGNSRDLDGMGKCKK